MICSEKQRQHGVDDKYTNLVWVNHTKYQRHTQNTNIFSFHDGSKRDLRIQYVRVATLIKAVVSPF